MAYVKLEKRLDTNKSFIYILRDANCHFLRCDLVLLHLHDNGLWRDVSSGLHINANAYGGIAVMCGAPYIWLINYFFPTIICFAINFARCRGCLSHTHFRFSKSLRVWKESSCILEKRVCRQPVYLEQNKIKWISSSTSFVSHKIHSISAKGSFLKRPDSIRIGKVPDLIWLHRDRLYLGKIILIYVVM